MSRSRYYPGSRRDFSWVDRREDIRDAWHADEIAGVPPVYRSHGRARRIQIAQDLARRFGFAPHPRKFLRIHGGKRIARMIRRTAAASERNRMLARLGAARRMSQAETDAFNERRLAEIRAELARRRAANIPPDLVINHARVAMLTGRRGKPCPPPNPPTVWEAVD